MHARVLTTSAAHEASVTEVAETRSGTLSCTDDDAARASLHQSAVSVTERFQPSQTSVYTFGYKVPLDTFGLKCDNAVFMLVRTVCCSLSDRYAC